MLKLKFFAILLCLVSFSFQSPAQVVTGQTAHKLKTKKSRAVESNYLLYLPENYGRTKEKFPLIMYLHGGSLRGSDVSVVRKYGLPQILETRKDFPFITVAPQCPAGEIWTDTDALIAVLDEVSRKYAVDPQRIYLTGHSMGGRGTWYLAYKYPERFAAIAPMSPNVTITAWTERLVNMPIWAFHGAKDEIAPLSESQTLIDGLKKLGANDLKFTVLEDRDHFILDMYENEELYKWFLQHRRK